MRTIAEMVRENRARRAIARQGYRLVKIRRRDTRAFDYGMWRIMPEKVADREYGPFTIDEVEAWIVR
jgi:hypothetical protein